MPAYCASILCQGPFQGGVFVFPCLSLIFILLGGDKIMRNIPASKIEEAVFKLCLRANFNLPADVVAGLSQAAQREESEIGRKVLQELLCNAELAAKELLPLCQDTGLVVVFVEMGQDVRVIDDIFAELPAQPAAQGQNSAPRFISFLEQAINRGVHRGYVEGYLRKSIVNDPLFERINTADNSPAIIHLRLVPGSGLRLVLTPKGGGCENKSLLRMLNPADGLEGVKQAVVQAVKEAGASACPPFVVGVGIGGNAEYALQLAKQALLRDLSQPHPHLRYAELENELLNLINATGLGPQGFGGRTTALKVHVEYAPCHIASLPVGVSISCHSARHASVNL